MDDVQELDVSSLGIQPLIGQSVPARSDDSDDADDGENSSCGRDDESGNSTEDCPYCTHHDDAEEEPGEEEGEDDEPGTFEGPTTWTGVDMDNLEQIRLKIVSAATPVPDEGLVTRSALI